MHTRVVKLASLSNAETTTTDNEDLLHINQVPGARDRAAVQVCLCIRRLLRLVP